jgi:hypothetical protein
VQIQNGRNQSIILDFVGNYFVIEDFDSNEEYEVSLRAVNEKGESAGSVTGKTKTERKGKYQTHNLYSL